MRNRRYSDNNRHFWPFTLSITKYKRLGAELNSGASEDAPGDCFFRLFLGQYVLTCELPKIIKDYRERHRLGRDWYDISYPREYSFVFTGEGSLHTYFGPDTGDSLTTKNKVFFLPWRNWRHVRYSLFDKNGKHFWTERDGSKTAWEAKRAVKQALSKIYFQIEDYDGEIITATTHIEEREWRFGTGLFRWLSFFVRPKIRRALSIDFSAEVGKDKGSWKGGVLGHGIQMLSDETHAEAFQRYCAQEFRSKEGKYHISNCGEIVLSEVISESMQTHA